MGGKILQPTLLLSIAAFLSKGQRRLQNDGEDDSAKLGDASQVVMER